MHLKILQNTTQKKILSAKIEFLRKIETSTYRKVHNCGYR